MFPHKFIKSNCNYYDYLDFYHYCLNLITILSLSLLSYLLIAIVVISILVMSALFRNTWQAQSELRWPKI